MKRIIFIFYCIFLFILLLFINLYYLQGIPHVPDDVAYVFMAKMFASGKIISFIPFSPEHFNFFPGILDVSQGKWLFQYPFGHPLLLSLGVLLGFPNIIPPLVGVLFVCITFLIAKEIYSEIAGIFVLFLALLSPFFLENASSFMSHNTAVLYLVLSIYFIILSLKNTHTFLFSLLSGIAIGLLFNTRPLTSIPFFLIILSIILLKQKKQKLPSGLLYLLGFNFLFLLWLLYNYVTTGNSTSSQYFLNNQHLFTDNTANFLSTRFSNFIILCKNFGPMLFNWPEIITYTILVIPLFMKERNIWDIYFFICILSLPIVYFSYNGTFIMYGPRFWYESLPFVLLLSGRSFSLLFTYLKKTTIILFILLAILSVGKFIGIIPVKNPDIFSPLSITYLKSFNFTDNRIITLANTLHIHQAVIFVKDCHNNWWCFGSVFPQNTPFLTTDIVYAKDLGSEKNIFLVKHFLDRTYYCADYDLNLITKIRYLPGSLENCP